MPELPEVEIVRRELEPILCGARIVEVVLRRRGLRAPFAAGFTVRLQARRVERLGRRGKYLVASIDSGETLLMHLGMSGSFRIEPIGGTLGPHDHVVFALSSGSAVIYNDPRRFGAMDLVAVGRLDTHRAYRALGPEPLDDGFNGETLASRCRGRRTSLKAALLDQRVVAGVGNIYASEALHLAGLSPRRRASSIATPGGRPRDAAHRLATAIKTVLERAIARAERGNYRGARFRVYEREGEACPRKGCGGTIRRIVQGARSTFFCPVCQR